MVHINITSPTPIYEQIKEQTEKSILSGLLLAMDKVFSITCLSAQLSVNPNTMQRAYMDMCHQGILISMMRKGYYVTNHAKSIIQDKAVKKYDALDAIVGDLLLAGIDKNKMIEHIESIETEKESYD